MITYTIFYSFPAVNFKPYESSEKKSKSSVISLSPPPPLAPIPFSSSSSPTATARLSSDGTSGVSHARRKSSPTSTPSNPKDLLAKHEAVISHFAGTSSSKKISTVFGTEMAYKN